MDNILNQTEVWRDKDGVDHRIDEMDGRYALNVYEYLKRTHQAVAYRYMSQLATMRMPDEDTAAYDIVSDAVEREVELIQEKPFHWLLDKPLMRALAARVMHDRIKRGTFEKIRVEAPSPLPDLYEAPEFEVRPPVEPTPEWEQQPGDETKVFMVFTGDYEDRSVDAVFVGNRAAAYQYAAEIDRYNPYDHVEVQAWDDRPIGGSETYGQRRRYWEAWNQVEYRTSVDLETGEVVYDAPPETEVTADEERAVLSVTEPEGQRGKFKARVVTTGPDAHIDEIRQVHADAVNQIRASVMEDIR